MKKELKDRWVKALREGEYKQGRSFLRRHDRYCCLGVLCDLAPVGEWGEQHNETVAFIFRGVWAEDLPPIVLLEELGLYPDLAFNLANMNDDGCTFDEIADVIETRVSVD